MLSNVLRNDNMFPHVCYSSIVQVIVRMFCDSMELCKKGKSHVAGEKKEFCCSHLVSMELESLRFAKYILAGARGQCGLTPS